MEPGERLGTHKLPSQKQLAFQENIVSDSASTPPPVRLSFTYWLILILASIGFAFDTYEIIKAQFVVPPAVQELGHFDAKTPEGRASILFWRSCMVYIPALAGGVFGLLGGYLTDLLGR